MKLKRILIKGLTRTGGTTDFTAIGSIRMYDGNNNLIQTTNTSSTNYSNFKSREFDATATTGYDNAYSLNNALNTTVSNGYFLANADNVNIDIIFNLDIGRISKIEFIPLVTAPRGINEPFKLEAYDESNNLIHSYDVTPITTIGEVQSVSTPSFRVPSNKILLSSNEKIYSIEKGVVKAENEIPLMTSNTTPSGVASSETNHSNGPAWKAFSGIDDQGYITLTGTVTGYLRYDFPYKATVAKYVIRSGMSTGTQLNAMPKNWTFEGSDNGSNWNVLDTQVNQTWTTIKTDREFIISNPKEYNFYRINWTANNGYASYSNINQLMMYTISSSKLNQISSPTPQNFINHGMDSLTKIDGVLTNKNYILSESSDTGEQGLKTIKIDRKPLSIKFD